MNFYRKSQTGNPIKSRVSLIGIGLAVFLLAALPSVAGAEGISLTTVQSGQVSGGLWCDPGIVWNGSATGGEIVEWTYSLPEFESIVWARLYIAEYCGHMSEAKPTYANIDFDGDGDGVYSDLANEYVNSTDMGVIPGSPHISRLSSNYVMWYDVTSLVTADNPSVKVDTAGSFDGRLKFLTLVVAYEDGDEDQVFYAVNQGHFGGVGTTTFDGSALPATWDSAEVLNVFLASADASEYTFNGVTVTPSEEQTLDFSGYNRFDGTEIATVGTNTFGWPGAGTSYRIPLVLASVSVPAPADIDLDVTAVSSNNDQLFAHEANTISATIGNTGTDDAGTFSVLFDFGDSQQTVVVSGLAAGASTTVPGIDPAERVVGDLVSITVTVDSTEVIAETSEENNELTLDKTVVNNGYKGKRYTDGDDIATRDIFVLNGGLIFSAGDSVYKSGTGGWTDYSATWSAGDLPVPGGASIREVRLYVPYTWDKSDILPDGVTLNFNGAIIPYSAHYQDRKAWGSSDYPYGLLVYNVTDQFLGSGNSATLTKPSANEISPRGMILVLIYEDASAPELLIFLNEEMDLLYGGPSYSTTPEEATAYAPFTGTSIDTDTVASATLITFAPGAGPNEGDLLFNGQTWTDVWNYLGGTQIGVDSHDVTPYLDAEGNEAGIQSNNDWMEASNAILIVAYEGEAVPSDIDLVVTAITPNNGELFAHEANTITATVNNTGIDDAGAFSVLFNFGDGQETVAVSGLAAGAGTTVSAPDPAERSAGDLVSITVTADSGGVIAETLEDNNELILEKTVVNNGYKGKRWTGGPDMTTQATFEGNIDVVYSAGDSAYNGASWAEKTYTWSSTDLPIPAGATVTSARLYQGYNYNKMATDPAWTMSFNGNPVTTVATYTDIKGFGSYNYPYGLYVYNVTGTFNTAGNSMTITPESGNNYGIYGAYLVVMYQDAGTTEKKIWINDEFDMVQSQAQYSVTSDEATAYAPFAGVDTSGVASAKAIAILSSAGDADKSKFFFNGNEYTGFWPNYQGTPQIGFSVYDVTSALLSGANEAGLQSYDPGTKGDNMYAQNVILVVEYEDQTPETVTLSLEPSSDAVPVGDTATYAIVMNYVPQGLAGYNISLVIDDPAIGEIVACSLPSWAVLNTTSDTFGDSIWLSGIDLQTQVEAGEEDVSFGTVTIRADQAGQTGLSLEYRKINADGGVNITPEVVPADFIAYVPLTADFTADPLTGTAPTDVSFTDLSTGDPLPATWAWDFNGDGVIDSTDQNPVFTYLTGGTYTVALTVSNAFCSDQMIREAYIFIRHHVIPLPGYTDPPTDPDNDNLYEDTNGNGYLDFDDVVAFYINMEWIEQNEPDPLAFDYNGNGYLDFDDVVVLYYEVLES